MQITPMFSQADTVAVTWCRASPLCHRDIDTIIRLKRTYDAVLVVLLPLAGGRVDVAAQAKLLRATFGRDAGVVGLPLADDCATADALRTALLATVANALTQAPQTLVFTPGEWPADTALDAAAAALLQAARQAFPASACRLDRTVIMAHDQTRRQIEEQPLKYWAQIAPQWRRRYKVTVALVGGPSTGKTTLAQDLANYYAAPASTEYARTYQPARNVMDAELDARDFRAILEGQYDRNRAVIEQPHAPGLMLADTETVTSAAYLQMMQAKEFIRLEPVIADLVARSQWTVLLILPPQAPFVDDHYRDAAQGDAHWRMAYHETLLTLLRRYYPQTKQVLLDAAPNRTHHDPEGYYARFNQAVREIDAVLAQGR